MGLEWIIEDQHQAFDVYQGFAGFDKLRLSGDGNVVIGTRWYEGAFRWDLSGELQRILSFSDLDIYNPGKTLTTQDGATVFVRLFQRIEGEPADESYQWTHATGTVKIADMVSVDDVSADGSVRLGTIDCNLSRSCNPDEFLTALRSEDGDQLVPQATNLSADGLTVAGVTGSTAFVWTPPGQHLVVLQDAGLCNGHRRQPRRDSGRRVRV